MTRRRGSHGTFRLPVLPRVQPFPSVPQRRDGAPPCASKAASPTKRHRSRAAAPPAGSLLGFPAAAPPPRSPSPPLSQEGILPDKSQNPRPDTPSLPPSSPPPGLLPRCSIPPDAANSRPASCWHLGHPPRPLLQQPRGSRHRADLGTWPSTVRFSGCLSGCCTSRHGGFPTFRACKRTQTTAVLEFIFCHPRNC